MNKPKLPLRALLLLLSGLGAASSVQALCLPLACSCSVSTTALSFGSYNPLAYGNTDSTGTVRVSCGGVVGLLIPYDIALSAGGGGSYAGRRMSYGGYNLSYNLYTSNTYTTVWGDGTASTQKVSGSVTLDLVGLSPTQIHWVYGRLPGRQLGVAPGGPYTDSMTVTLTYY